MNFITYGATTCPRCNSQHDRTYQIPEDERTRSRALKIAAFLIFEPAKRDSRKLWTDYKTKADKLAALRGMKGGVLMVRPEYNKWGVEELRERILELVYGGHIMSVRRTLEGLAAKLRLKPDQLRPVLNEMVDDKVLDKLRDEYRANEVFSDEYVRPPVEMPQSGSGCNREFMIGVLVTQPRTYITASGDNIHLLDKYAKDHGYIQCEKRTAQAGVHQTIKGEKISADEYEKTLGEHATPPGNCAAPRLLERAFQDQDAVAALSTWRMSEIWYQPKPQANPQAKDLCWTHAVSAHHCLTCEKLVPLLLCPSASTNLTKIQI